MASVAHNGDGVRRIIFTAPSGKVREIKGHFTAREADTIRRNVAELVKSSLSSEAPPLSTTEWVSGLPDRLHRRLEGMGLVRPRERREAPTVKEWIAKYIEGRTDAQPSTVCNMGQAQHTLIECLGSEKTLPDVTAADGDAYAIFLRAKLSEATVRRQIGRAKQFFNAAVRAELLVRNPFRHLQSTDFVNPERIHDVTAAEITAILKEASSIDLKLAVAFSYYAGLRTPSESCRLRWVDVDFAKSMLQVRATKTQRHGGNSALREVPISPPLLALLLDAYEQAPEGSERIITRYDGRANLRTEVLRAMTRAGVTPFDKFFQNCRSTCETNWLAAGITEFQVGLWMGHAVKVARKHYDKVRADSAKLVIDGGIEGQEKGTRKSTQKEADSIGTTGNDAPESAEIRPIPGVSEPVGSGTSPTRT